VHGGELGRHCRMQVQGRMEVVDLRGKEAGGTPLLVIPI
jgi:hypothetical protein